MSGRKLKCLTYNWERKMVMSVLGREQFLEKISAMVGDDTSDTSISFIEDMTETYDSLANSDNEDWKKKYEENDASWRQRYRERFFSGSNGDEDDEPNEPHKEPTTFEELFTVKEN